VAAFYYAAILVTMVCRFTMLRILKTAPGLLAQEGRATGRRIEDLYTDCYLSVIVMVIAFAIALAVPVLQRRRR
jgi:hypothetical protein